MCQGSAIAICGGLGVFDCASGQGGGLQRGESEALPAGTGKIPGNSDAPIPVDPCPLFESREVTIDRVFRISVQVVVEGRDLTA